MNESEKMVVKQDNIKKSCFVITPIGKETDSIRRHIDGIIEAVIEPVLKKYDYEMYVPHQMSMPGSIDKQIIKKIYQCELVIVNLTDVNPNVMYELALRHCFGTPLIIIAEKDTKLPFDIENQRTIFYINDAKGVISLRTDLERAINELNGDNTYESPVITTLKEFKIEEKVINDKAISVDENEVDAWRVIFEKLNRIEQCVNSGKYSNNSKSSTIIEHEFLITGETEISYRLRESLRYLMNLIGVTYMMERSADDLKMSIVMQFPTTQNWKHFVENVKNICKSYEVSMKIIR